MTRITTSILFLAVSAAYALGQPVTRDVSMLLWNEFYKLQWSDFQGEIDETSAGDAGTAVKITAQPYIEDNEIHYTVEALFNRKKSWVRDKSLSLLAHEQLHFDIAELYARKIRKKIRELQRRGVDDIDVFNRAIQELLLESNEVDAQYDLETLHGAMSRKQAEWSERIKNQLAELIKYRKQKRVIGVSK